eukprot:m.134873 g.134873  ORF g.134873 m.134873 type:complete len:455 (-) comp20145_c2_seq1:27-1391(-)
MEFLQRMQEAARMRRHENRVMRIFLQLDKNHDGFVSVEELAAALADEGYAHPHDMALAIISRTRADLDGDNRLSFDEFLAAVNSTPENVSESQVLNSLCRATAETVSDIYFPIPPDITLHTKGSVALYHFIFASIVSTTVSRTFTAPLELIRVQAHVDISTKAEPVLKSLKDTYRSFGVRGLFRGNLVNVTRALPFSCVSSGAFVSLLPFVPDGASPAYRGFVGGISGSLATIATQPLDVVRTRISAQLIPIQSRSPKVAPLPVGLNPYYTSLPDAFRKIYREEGYHGLYKGLGAAIMGVVPFAFIHSTSYTYLRDRFCPPSSDNYLLRVSACGAAAGMLAQTVVHPLEVIKRQLEVQHDSFLKNELLAGEQVRNQGRRSVWQIGKHIVQDYGWLRLYNGLSISYMKTIPLMFIGVAVRELSLKTTKRLQYGSDDQLLQHHLLQKHEHAPHVQE